MAAQPVRPVFGLIAITLLGVVYFALATLSLLVAFPHSSASPVWPVTGLALAAVLVWGPRVWPGIALGAFAANVATSLSHQMALPVALWSSGIIAMGNTAEALLGAYLVTRFAGGTGTFERAEYVVKFLVAAVLATAASATVGATTLCESGMVPWANYPPVWWTWWSGDMGGALIVTPLLLAWRRAPLRKPSRGRVLEIVVLAAALAAVGRIVFVGGYPVAYLLVPLVLFATFRYGQTGAATMTFLIATIMIAGTILQRGPFVRDTLNNSLLFLQAFVWVFAVMAMVLAAVLSERRADRIQLAEYNRRLEVQIAIVREAELSEEQARRKAEAAAAEAERANRTKSEFLAVMSHELRTPLNAIGGYAELLESGVRGQLTEAQLHDLSRIRRSERHLLRMINDLLNFTKLEAGQVSFNVADVALDAVLREAAEAVALQLSARGLKYTYRCADPTASAYADRDKLQQIITNLLSNAMKFTDSGGEIALECVATDGAIAVVVRDTGRGIAPDKLEEIFAPFVQLDVGHKRTTEGTGLGLAISRDLARAMGGDLTAANGTDCGSVFTLTLLRVGVHDQGPNAALPPGLATAGTAAPGS